jgi:predicted deacetylase
MKTSPFRVWLQNLWMDNKDEHVDAGELVLPLEEYFRRYKWWLKREYQHQQRLNRV